MKLSEIEKYREEDGYINIDKAIEEKPSLLNDILRESRGSQNREKDWIQLEDTKILLRTENLIHEDVIYTSYAELLVEEVAKQVKMPCAHYDLIKYKGEKGVLSQNVLKEENDVLISGSTLLRNIDHYRNTQDMLDFINIEDILESFEYLTEFDNIDKKNIEKLKEQFLKIGVFDIFTISTDRNGGNFAIKFNSIAKEFNVSPIFDNEHSLGGCISREVLRSISENNNVAKIESENLLSVLEAPEEFSESIADDWKNICPRIKESHKAPLNWQTLLFYIDDYDSDTLNDFVLDCYNKIDIEKAFASVEERIKINVPEEYKKGVLNIYNERKSYIKDCLCIEDLEEELEYEDGNCLE